MNKVFIKGRIANDLEVRQGTNGNNFLPFALAVKPSNKKDEDVIYIDCVAFKNNADYASKYLKKGNLILIEGELNQRKFTRQDGTKGSKLEVVVARIENLEKREKSDAEEPETSSDDLESIDLPDDDLPF